MNIAQWLKVRKAIHEEFYDALVGTAGCGAFDGGCVVVAQALQQVIGGEIVVLTRADGLADHAAVLQGGKLWDYDGPMAPARFIDSFNRKEQAHCTEFRPLRDGDLPNAYRNPNLVVKLHDIFGRCVDPQSFTIGIGERAAEWRGNRTPKFPTPGM